MNITLPEYTGKGGSAGRVVGSHGVYVAFGAYTRLCLSDLDLNIEGAAELEQMCQPYVEKIREAEKGLKKDGDSQPDSLPIGLVRPLRNLAIKIFLEHLSKKPVEFDRWLKEREDDCFQRGRRAQAEIIRSSIMFGEEYT